MNEATFQTVAMHAMKFVCCELNKKMSMYVTSSNEQSPVDGEGRPYDVGVLLDNAYLVGIEFKVYEEGCFRSWNKEQHETYVGLTNGRHIELPLYYAYNAIEGAKINRMYADDQFIPILEGSKISLPIDLPGARPSVQSHENIYNWLLDILHDSSKSEKNGWTTISVKNGWDSSDEGRLVLLDILQNFPDIIWLLVTAHNGLRVSWALTSKEMEEHVSKLRATWKQKNIRSVEVNNRKQAYLEIIEESDKYLRSVQANIANQRSNEEDMDDKPENRGSRLGM